MGWLKEVIVDLLVTIFIIVTVYLSETWMMWTLWIYTGLMVITKGVVLMGSGVRQLMKKSKISAPEWFSHLLYATNTGVLLYTGWWYTAAGWMVIWVLSYLTHIRLDPGRRVSQNA